MFFPKTFLASELCNYILKTQGLPILLYLDFLIFKLLILIFLFVLERKREREKKTSM